MENLSSGGMPERKEPAQNAENSNVTTTTPEIKETTQAPQEKPAEQANTTATKTEEAPKSSGEKEKSGLLKSALEGEKEAQEYWKDDWREKMADGDEKVLKMLQKYKSPSEAAKGQRELESQFHKTRPLPELPKDATPEQIKEYREKAGIPQKWEEYSRDLKDGVVIGKESEETVNEFLKAAHNKNMTQAEVSKSLQAYFEMQNASNAKAIAELEAKQKANTEALQKEWGSQFKSNITKIASYVESELGSDALDALDQAILPDGSLLFHNQKLANHFLKLAESRGGHTQTPQESQTFTSLHTRKAELERMAAADKQAWYNNRDARQELAQITEQLKTGKYK